MAKDDDEEMLTVRVPADLMRHARSVAASRDETLSQVVRKMLRAYVNKGPLQLDLVVAAETAKAAKPTKPKPAIKRSR